MAQMPSITIDVILNFNQLEKLFQKYLVEVSDDDGTEIFVSYRENAKDQLDLFLDWLKKNHHHLTPSALRASPPNASHLGEKD